MKLTTDMRNKLPSRFFGLPRNREYPMAVIINNKPTWDKRHAALAKGRAKQQFARGFLSTMQYNRIVKKADKVLAMKKSRKLKANTAVRMDETFDDPGWKKYKRSAIKKQRKVTKKNTPKRKNLFGFKQKTDKSVKYTADGKLKRYKIVFTKRRGTPGSFTEYFETAKEVQDIIKMNKPRDDVFRKIEVYKDGVLQKRYYTRTQNTTVPSGSTTGGGYMFAMRGLREGDYAQRTRSKQANKNYIPVGYSSETGKDIVDTALVAGKKLNPKKKKRKSTKGWYKFSMFAKSGKKLGVRIGQGTKTEADKTGKRYLGSKQKGRIVHRLIIDGPYKNKPTV